MNSDMFYKYGIKIALIKKRPLSYLEITLPKHKINY